MSKRQLIIDVIGDLVSNLMYYDRKEDEDLPVDEIEKSVESGEITIEDMAQEFRDQLYMCFGEKSPKGGQDV